MRKRRSVVKYVLYLLIGLRLCQPVWAQNDDKTLVTKSGETYQNYKITTANAQGIIIKHSSGTAAVTPENWPDNKKNEIVPYLPIVAEKRKKLVKAQKDVKTEPSSQNSVNQSSDNYPSGTTSAAASNSSGGTTVKPSASPSDDTSSRSPSYSKSSNSSSGAKTVQVKSYTRKDGTVVRAHTRSAPRRR